MNERYRQRLELIRAANAARLERVSAPVSASSAVASPAVTTTPVWTANSFLTLIDADLVRSGEPNRNGALFLDEDLLFGLPSVVNRPVNFAHNTMEVCGVITAAEIVPSPDGNGGVIRIQGTLWDWVQVDDVIETRAWLETDPGSAFVSMECIPNHVQCTGPNGCGEFFDYLDVLMGECCVHILNRTSIRRMVNPVFQGAAIILPPVKPGWSEAHLRSV